MIQPIRPRYLKVSEIFLSIQGEGTRAGMPCVFVRLHGCGLRCSWCDTPYALDHREGGQWMSFDDVVSQVRAHGATFVELTGGEPLEQPAALDFMRELLDAGYTVAVETGGHVDIADVDSRVIRIVDLKTPSSGMQKRNRLENLTVLAPHDELKFVCASRDDYEWSRALIVEHALDRRVAAVLISPVFGRIDASNLVRWILEDRLPVRFQLQMHKFIWEPDARGV